MIDKSYVHPSPFKSPVYQPSGIEHAVKEWEINLSDIHYDSVRVVIEAESRIILPQNGKYCIGKGGFGSIYLVEYNNTLAAMKHLTIREGDSNSNSDEFLRELQTLVLLRHPNVLLYLGGSGSKQQIFFLTELMEGDLNRMIKKKDPRALWNNQGKYYMIDIISAISYLHKKKLAHKDIKSLNILINRNTAKLSDFGLVKSLQDNATNRIITKERAYSLVWASPEQLNPHSIVSFSTDIYSFGIVVWEVLNHQQPWEGFKDLQMMFATVSGRFKDYHSFPPETSPDIMKMCLSCWSLSPQERPSAENIEILLSKLQTTGKL